MYKCEHFDIKELVPKHVYEALGERRCYALMDTRLLMSIDAIREHLGSCTINSWSWGGARNDSGFRDNTFYDSDADYIKSRSQHKYGRAADCILKDVSAQDARKFILENPEYFPYVTFIECGEVKGEPMNWLHVDVRTSELMCYSPDRGVVSPEVVIKERL